MLRCVTMMILYLFAGGASGAEVVVPAGAAPVRSAGTPWQETGWSYAGGQTVGVWLKIPLAAARQVTVVAAGRPAGTHWPTMVVTAEQQRNGSIVQDQLARVTVDTPAARSYTWSLAPTSEEVLLSIHCLTGMAADISQADAPQLQLAELRIDEGELLAEPPVWWLPLGHDADQMRGLTDRSIAFHRMATLTVYTKPRATVEIRQQRHAFGFGAALSSELFSRSTSRTVRDKYLRTVEENFNTVMPRGAFGWARTEPSPDNIDYNAVDRMCHWCNYHDVRIRGGAVFGCERQQVPDWSDRLADEALRSAMQRHATDITLRYRGTIDELDVLEGLTHGNYYVNRFGPEICHDIFRWVAAGNRDARICVSDRDMLTDDFHATLFIEQMRGLSDQKLPLGGINCEARFTEPLDVNQVQRTLDRLAELGRPIIISQYEFESEDPQLRADHLEQFFRICFAHPRVESIYLRTFWQSTREGDDVGLWRSDWSPTRVAEIYRQLIFNQWWTDYSGQADEHGVCRIRVFRGTHHVRVNGGSPTDVTIPLDAQERTLRFP